MSKIKISPIFLWVVLWIVGQLIIGVRNDLIIMGTLSSLPEIIIASLFINILFIPAIIILFFIIKFLSKKIQKKDLFSGENGLRNVAMTWAILYTALFLYGFAK